MGQGTALARIIVLGLAVRVALAPFTANPWDVKVWTDVGYKTLIQGANIYQTPVDGSWAWGYYAYPPGWLMWCTVSYMFASDPHLHALVLKLPIIAADLAIACCIYRALKDVTGSKRGSLSACSLFLFNPFTIAISSVWGTFDAIPALLTFISAFSLYKKRVTTSAFTLGLGILFKIYPLFLLPVFLLYAFRHVEKGWRHAATLLGISCGVPALLSLPFILEDPRSYFQAFLAHTQPTGWLSYWFPLSHMSLLFNKYSGVIFAILFLAAYAFLTFRRKLPLSHDFPSLNRSMLIIFLLFFITSPKVNAQYVMWAIPSMMVEVYSFKNALSRNYTVALILLDLVLILSLLPINNYFVLNALVKFPEAPSASLLLSISLVVAFLFPSICIRFFQQLLRAKLGWGPRTKVAVGALLAAILLTISFFMIPLPRSLVADKDLTVIAFPESPATGFTLQQVEFGARGFLQKYESDSVVLAFGPDFVNTFERFTPSNRVNRFFKASYYEEWTEADIRDLTKRLHDREKEVILGVYLVSDLLVNGRGFVSPWIDGQHPEVVEGKALIFSASLKIPGSPNDQVYARYFRDRIVKVVDAFSFDGVLLSMVSEDQNLSPLFLSGLRDLVLDLSPVLKEKDLTLAVTGFLDQEAFEVLKPVICNIDILVMETPTFSEGVYSLSPKGDPSVLQKALQRYKTELNGESEFFFTLEVMDEQEGWVNSDYFLMRQYEEFSPFCDGLVLTFANRHSPYQIMAAGS